MHLKPAHTLLALLLTAAVASMALAQCPPSVPVEGAAPPGPLPVFPSDHWWNIDVSSAPIDPASSSYIAFINNGGTRRLHPDFGGEASPGSVDIYGMPYAIVNGAQPKQAVTFQYWDESDGVDYATHQGVPFYPIPAQAITQPHWVEGGAPGNIDQRSDDRHLLVIDCTNQYLYELYNVYYDTSQAKWYAGSGAFFDMKTNNRRPDGWTSADAAGLAIFPGLVRYDEAWDPAVTDIGHAFRVTVRATNGYVYPASHRAGSTSGALPMGARLRLKKNVGGADPALRTTDPNVQKIFRAMQKYGVIVADNGSDMYITGTFDTRWNNDILNPAFALITASDFEVIELGWNPPAGAPALTSISANPNQVVGGNASTGSVALTSAAPAGGAIVSLSSGSGAVSVPASVSIPQGAASTPFGITTSAVTSTTSTTLSATYGSITKTTTFTVTPAATTPALATLSVNRTTIVGGTSTVGTVTLTAAAPSGGATVALTSSQPQVAFVPANVVVPAGTTSVTFTVSTAVTKKNAVATISANYAGVTKTTTIKITRR
jgi:plastocyanin